MPFKPIIKRSELILHFCERLPNGALNYLRHGI